MARTPLQRFRSFAVRSPRILSVLLGLFAGLSLLAFRLNATIDRQLTELELASYDLRVRLRGERPLSDDLILVGITDYDLDFYNRQIISRQHHFDLLQTLTNLGARAAIFDIVFIDEIDREIAGALAQDYDGDEHLAFQMSLLQTYLAYTFYISIQYEDHFQQMPFGHWLLPADQVIGARASDEFTADQIRLPAPLLAGAARGLGHINVFPDSDGVVRRVPILLRYHGPVRTLGTEDGESEVVMGDGYSPALPLRYVLDRLGVRLSDLTVRMGDAITFTTSDGERHRIPIDEHGQMLINFRQGKGFTERGFSSEIVHRIGELLFTGRETEIAQMEGDDFLIYDRPIAGDQFEGATVLIGDIAQGSTDIRATPLDRALPMLTIHANLIEQLLRRDHVIESPAWLEPLLTVLFGLVSGYFFGRIGYIPSFTFFLIASFGYVLVAWAAFVQFNAWLPLVMPIVSMLASGLLILLLHLVIEDKRRAVIRGAFEAYTSPEVVDTILVNMDDPALWGARRKVTALFVDIRGFTTLTEQTSPEQIVEVLNAFYSVVVECVRRHGGIPNKFIGDEIMALFNAPREIEHSEEAACRAAIDIQLGVVKLNREVLGPRLGKEIRVGVGINTDEVIVGIVGSEKIEYTALGDGVNIASRLQGQCRPGQILIGPLTLQALREGSMDFLNTEIKELREIPEIVLKGLRRRLTVYELCYH